MNETLPIAIKTILATYYFRAHILEDVTTLKIFELINKIKSSNRFYDKNIYNKKSIFEMFTNFLEKDYSSSEDEVDSKMKNGNNKVNKKKFKTSKRKIKMKFLLILIFFIESNRKY